MVTYEFRLPDPGEGLTEAEIDTWYVEAGGEIAEDDRLCDVETDKALVEIPAPCTGTVTELVAEVGEVVAVGEVIAVFETENPPERAPTEGTEGSAGTDGTESADASEETDAGEGTEASEATPQDDPTLGPSTNGETKTDERAGNGTDAAESGMERNSTGTAETTNTDTTKSDVGENDDSDARVFAAPSTRRYAREQSVSLDAMDGSGPNGRVLREDVDAHVESAETPATATEPATGANAGTEAVGTETATATTVETGQPAADAASAGTDTGTADDATRAVDADDREVRRPLRGLRGKIAENTARSARTIPHVTSGFECDAGELVSLKERLDETYDQRITYTPILVKALVPGLQAFPSLNASVDDEAEEIVEKRYYNVGVAVHTDAGLLVPVVKNVDRKSIVEIAAELEELVAAARERTIEPTDLQGGTFTITNVGSHGEHGTFGTPIINHPEAAIMGVGAISDEPVAVSESEFGVRKRLSISLSYDHRIIDGVTAGAFAEHVIEGIEDPKMLLSRL
jgi:pyruvate dehydrogenase E2 component (dihydrolipoamide acetyltransferase)